MNYVLVAAESRKNQHQTLLNAATLSYERNTISKLGQSRSVFTVDKVALF
jgi:hypothetical protein